MKKLFTFFFSFLFFAIVQTSSCFAQNIEHDFFLSVLANPTLSLYDFYLVGLNANNTEFLPKYRYAESEKSKKMCKDANLTVDEAYRKCNAAWTLFKRISKYDRDYVARVMCNYGPNNIFAPQCPDPQLRHDMNIVPLKLK